MKQLSNSAAAIKGLGVLNAQMAYFSLDMVCSWVIQEMTATTTFLSNGGNISNQEIHLDPSQYFSFSRWGFTLMNKTNLFLKQIKA